MAGGVPAPIGAAFEALDRAGGRWALLRGEADLATTGGDVDVLVAPESLAASRRELAVAGFAPVPGWGRPSCVHGACISKATSWASSC